MVIKRLPDGNLEVTCIFCNTKFTCSGMCLIPLGKDNHMRDRSDSLLETHSVTVFHAVNNR